MKKSKIVLMILFVAIAITSCTRSAAVSLVGTATPGKVSETVFLQCDSSTRVFTGQDNFNLEWHLVMLLKYSTF